MARPRSRASTHVVALTPRDPAGALPSWDPPTPVAGWTPSAARQAAAAYAVAHAEETELPPARLEGAAFRALCAVAPGLHRAWVRERLRQQDVTGDGA